MTLLVVTLAFIAIVNYVWSNPRQFHFGPVLWAERLSEKPAEYIVVTDPDPYLLEALSKPETEVFIGYWENTNIDELVMAYDTNNVEYNGNYYEVIMMTDHPIFTGFAFFLLFCWIVLGIGFLISHVTARRA